MGRRGPPPRPRVFRPMQGDRDLRGHRTIHDLAPAAERGMPSLPSWLKGEARREWRRIVPDLDRAGMLCKVDRAALAAYCQAWAELVEAVKILDRDGRIIDVDVFGKEGEVVGTKKVIHPAHRLMREGSARIKQFLGEFGLTPSSRTRLHAPPRADAGKGDDPEEEFFRGEGDRRKG